MDVKGMREILFRGKDPETRKWYEGFYMALSDTTYCFEEDYAAHPENTKHYIVFDEMTDWCLPNRHLRAEVDPSTVGQYTGLTDKNGKKIFEGDIVDASNEWWNSAGPAGHDSPVILVEWESDLCGFEPFANYDCDCGVYINAKNCEVLGNIHDNPELLEDFNVEE